MTGPMIPADQWPEWADRHCWNQDGSGIFCGASATADGVWIRTLAGSGIPMPAGHDWRVPVMRPAAEEVRAQANMDAGWYARREAHAHDMGYTGVAEALEDLERRRNTPAIDLEQFREAVEALHAANIAQELARAPGYPSIQFQRTAQKCIDLMALIDGQAGPDLIGDALGAMGNAYPLTGAGIQTALAGEQPTKGEGVANVP